MIPAAFTTRLGIILKSAFQNDLHPFWSNLVYMLGSLRCGELFMWPFGIESLAGRSLMVGRHTLMAGPPDGGWIPCAAVAGSLLPPCPHECDNSVAS